MRVRISPEAQRYRVGGIRSVHPLMSGEDKADPVLLARWDAGSRKVSTETGNPERLRIPLGVCAGRYDNYVQSPKLSPVMSENRR